jgi:hypoxanthine phosphoribosyltransferase
MVGRMPEPRLGAVLISADAIAARVAELAAAIDTAYAEAAQPPVLVCVLTGSLLFTADLARALRLPVEIETVAARSYGGTESRGTVQLLKDVSRPLLGRDVLIVEDIIDTGETTAFLRDHLAQHRPASLRLVALLDKRARRRRGVRIDFRGFVVRDRFVVGYGLDLDERWRELPDVHLLDES